MGGLLRWVLMSVTTLYEITLLLQTLHALSFAATHLGTMHFIRLMVPAPIKNRAQALYSAMSGGLLMSCSVWGSGQLYQLYGGYAFVFMAGLSIAALVLALTMIRLSPTVRAAGEA
jgi:MFS transporter, PPP family, 3-phenylpropionic acid transporter